ncbi:branched-chain amino acid ABC transporter substrate-binding protein [Thiomonas sp. FB-Cd]|uniref:branched-chain amino acid ABC transporter substrate-binding protein n=1 Tax=Thiomonas sp. FB-Cd TaxID=1158292 RepID=UPI0004DF7699|nr:branched-chain amino acid ABC transporter substrate-binding protein [Thiomonas sp. FB-Cd]
MLVEKAFYAVALASSVAFTAQGAAHAAGSVIKFGVQAPITGQYANEGQGISNAAKLLAAEWNKRGGLLGRRIVVELCDDQGQAAQGAICARQFVNDGVLAVIGSYTSGAALAAEPIYAASSIIQTSDGTSDQLTAHGYKTFFRNAPPNSAEAVFTAKYFVAKGYRKVAVITDHSSFATGLAQSVIAEAKKAGVDIVDEAYINAGTQDYTPVLTKLGALHPDAVYFSGYYTDGGLIKAQMSQLGLKAPFIGGDANQNTAFAKIAGTAAAGAVIINVPAPQDLPYKSAQKFLANYRAMYGKAPPSVYTLTNADGMRAILQTAERIKTVKPTELIPALHHLSRFNGYTGQFSWNEAGERIGSGFVAFVITPSAGYRIVYPKSGD